MLKLALIFLIGFLIGAIIGLVISLNKSPKRVGNLRMDHSDPDSPYLFLELEENMDDLLKQKEVALRVRVEDYISQK